MSLSNVSAFRIIGKLITIINFVYILMFFACGNAGRINVMSVCTARRRKDVSRKSIASAYSRL